MGTPLPAPQFDRAKAVLKDPYCFDFLTLRKQANNRELENNTDKPSIGLILRKENNRIVAEYVLRDMGKPMGITE